MQLPIGLDFETHAIQARPDYPPRPVGLAIKEPGKRGIYLAFGHSEANNCTEAEARARLQAIYRSGRSTVWHNAKFDLDVAETHWQLPAPPWHRVHDTLLLAFLDNPHASTLELKPLAERLLQLPPAERDELREWILMHVPEARRAKSKWGAFISHAPGKIAAPYAIGDVDRTVRLWRHLHMRVVREGQMGYAYDRERRLQPTLLRMEHAGVPVPTERLGEDLAAWENGLGAADNWLRRRLGADISIDSDNDFADAIEIAGLLRPEGWQKTEKGNRSISKENLPKAIADEEFLSVYSYRQKLAHAVRNIGRPWLRMAQATGGLISCSWNPVRSTEGGRALGARTGRLSSTPNFQNVPKVPTLIAFNSRETARLQSLNDQSDLGTQILKLPHQLRGRIYAASFPGIDALALPHLRDYIIPGKGWRLNNRDYSQQELRALGHYEDGVLLRAYLEDPQLDVHEFVKNLVNNELGSNFPRRPIKNVVFGLIYGMGVGKLASAIGCDLETARLLKYAVLDVLPGVKDLDQEMKRRGREKKPIRTWGGRLYHVEPPKLIRKGPRRGEVQDFAYKLLNILIQGSSADATKEAMIRYDELRRGTVVEDAAGSCGLLLTVHDELMTRAPCKVADEDMRLLREAMESVEFDVPMISEGAVSTMSWARCEGYDDRGSREAK